MSHPTWAKVVLRKYHQVFDSKRQRHCAYWLRHLLIVIVIYSPEQSQRQLVLPCTTAHPLNAPKLAATLRRCPEMKHFYYVLLTGAPLAAVVTTVAVLIIIGLVSPCCRKKTLNSMGWIISKAFPGILRSKEEMENRSTRWLIHDIDVTDSPHRGYIIFIMFVVTDALFVLIALVFCQTLLLEVSYNCDLEDPTKECFVFHSMIYPFLKLWDDPVECSEVSSGDVPVICYRVVFDVSAAVGVSVGTLKVFSAVLTVLTWVLLIPKRATCLNIIQSILVFLLTFGVLPVVFIFFNVILPIMLLQLVAIIAVITIIFFLPWDHLIKLQNQQTRYSENGGANSRNRVVPNACMP